MLYNKRSFQFSVKAVPQVARLKMLKARNKGFIGYSNKFEDTPCFLNPRKDRVVFDCPSKQCMGLLFLSRITKKKCAALLHKRIRENNIIKAAF